METVNYINETYVEKGKFGEEYVKSCIAKYPGFSYEDVFQNHQYQKMDVDIIGNFGGARVGLEVKQDTMASQTGRLFIELLTHAESKDFDYRLIYKIGDWFRNRNVFSINDFTRAFTDIIPKKTMGCNIKSQADRLIYVISKDGERNNDYPILSVRNNEFKDFPFDKKNIYFPKGKWGLGWVKHKNRDEALNFGFCIPLDYMIKLPFVSDFEIGLKTLNEKLTQKL